MRFPPTKLLIYLNSHFRSFAFWLVLFSHFTVISGFSQTGRLDNPVTTDWIKKNLSKKELHLILNPQILGLLEKKIQSDSLCRLQFEVLRQLGDSFLIAPPLTRTLEGIRLLGVSRNALNRLTTLSLLYKITNQKQYLRRVESDLISLSAYSDWNPSHFLDVAEMALGVSLALNWCGNDLSIESRKNSKQALRKHILFSFEENPGFNWWISAENNWNQVCHGGMIAAALVLANDESDLSAKVISRALDNIPKAMQAYFPDGAYIEGPSYWTYGTSYTLVTISLLESVFNTDFGIAKFSGFMESAGYRLAMSAPSGKSFNYFDAGEEGLSASDLGALSWFALSTGDRMYMPFDAWKVALTAKQKSRMAAISLIWSAGFKEKKHSVFPQAWKGQGPNPLVVFQSPGKKLYLAAKGGAASLNHSNMDAGSFIFESQGVRWAIDPGNQDYNPLERVMGGKLWERMQNSARWTLLTKNNFYHNTLTVNDSLHKVNGHAPLVSFDSVGKSATFQLDSLFGSGRVSAKRVISLLKNSGMEVTDSLVFGVGMRTISWTLMTTAEVQLVSGGAVLKQDGKSVQLQILEPSQVQLSVIPCSPPPLPYDKNISLLKKLEIRIPAWIFDRGKGIIRVQILDANP
jgi:hypothetical protein